MPPRGKVSSTPATRSKLRPMRSSDHFRDFVLHQLAGITDVRAKAMFGGIGLYAGDVFFGLIVRDVLHLKVDDRNRARYEAAGCHAFRPYADRPMTMAYYDVPVGVLEDAEALAAWAAVSITIAATKARPTKRQGA